MMAHISKIKNFADNNEVIGLKVPGENFWVTLVIPSFRRRNADTRAICLLLQNIIFFYGKRHYALMPYENLQIVSDFCVKNLVYSDKIDIKERENLKKIQQVVEIVQGPKLKPRFIKVRTSVRR